MKTLTDTHPAIEQRLIAMLRDTPITAKLQTMFRLNHMAQAIVLDGLRQRYPRATEDDLHRRLADIRLGETLARTVYGPLPDSVSQP